MELFLSNSPLIIITGAAGFIGSAIAWRLNQSGYRNLLLVDQIGSEATSKNLVGLFYTEFIDKVDFLSRVQAGKYDASNIAALFHLGACSSTMEMDEQFLSKNNFEYTQTLAEFCCNRKNPIRFIYASSAATYGDGSQGYSDSHENIRNLRPLNPYGYSKQNFDLWALENGYLEKIVGLKYFNVFGPNEYHKGDMRSMVLKAYEKIKQTDRMELFKSHRPEYQDGEQVRDFIYIKDAVEMTLFFLTYPNANGIYNIGTGIAHSWLSMANALFHAMQLPPKIDFVPMPETLRDKYQYHTCADISKLRRAGYSDPIRSLDASVLDYTLYLNANYKILS